MSIEGRRGQRRVDNRNHRDIHHQRVRRLPGPSYHHRRHDGPRAHVDAPVHVATSCHCHCCNGTCCRHCFRHSALPRRVYSDHDWLLPQAFFLEESNGVERVQIYRIVGWVLFPLGLILLTFGIFVCCTPAPLRQRSVEQRPVQSCQALGPPPPSTTHILSSGTYIINLSSHSLSSF